MDPSRLKLVFNPNTFKVKVEFTKEQALKIGDPPDNVFERAYAKLDSLLASKTIAKYRVFTDHLEMVWDGVKESENIPPDLTIQMVLAESFPPVDGVVVSPGEGSGVAKFSLTAPAPVLAKMNPEWIYSYVKHVLREQRVYDTPNFAQICGAWYRATFGERIQNMVVTARPTIKSLAGSKSYVITANRSRGEISLIIKDVVRFQREHSAEGAVEIIRVAADKASSSHQCHYLVLKDSIYSGYQAITHGPELLGFDLPALILGAVRSTGSEAELKPRDPYPGFGRLVLDISDDLMEAKIGRMPDDLYSDKGFQPGEAWLRQELKRLGIDEKAFGDFLPRILKMIESQVDLEDKIIARGTIPVSASGPYLKDVTAPDIEAETGDPTEAGSRHRRPVVKEGDVVAEIRFQKQPQPGIDVYGHASEPKLPNLPRIRLRGGVDADEKGLVFTANIDGVPRVDPNNRAVGVSEIMEHNGDIDIKSGDIEYDGDVIINGDVESGARVYAAGDLTIRGSIRNATVHCQGNLVVLEGINTGRRGRVTVGGDLEVEFAENSRISCGGNLIIRKAAINCELISGRSIIADLTSGIVAGGVVSCRDNLYTGTLGFKNGARTVLKIGIDWKTDRALKIKESRMVRLERNWEESRMALQEINKKSQNQMTDKHEARKSHLNLRVARLKNVIAKLQHQMEKLRANMTFNEKAKVFVKGPVFSNIVALVGGTQVPLRGDSRGVALLGRKRNGNRVVPFGLGIQLDEKDKGNSGSSASQGESGYRPPGEYEPPDD